MRLLDTPVAAPGRVRSPRPVHWGRLPVALLVAWGALAILAGLPIVVNMINTPQQEHTMESAIQIGSVSLAVLLGTPADIGPTHLTLMPWGFTLVAIAVFWWVGRWMMSSCGRRWPLSGGVLLGAAVLTGIASGVVGMNAQLGDVRFSGIQVGAFGFAIACLGFGAALLIALRDRQPRIVRQAIRGATVAVFALVAVGAFLLLISFLRNVTLAQELFDALQPTVGTGALITGLQIGYLPVMIAWAISYLTGAGFFLGAQTLISPFIAHVAPVELPPLPILAAVPTSATPAAWVFPVTVVIIGALAAQVAMRGLTGPRWFGFVAAGGMALGAAVIVTLLAVMSAGALGVEQLATLGPTPSVVGFLVAGLLFVGALPRAVFFARA